MTQTVKLFAVCAALCACARTGPPRDSTAALYRDLQRIVTLTEAAGWEIDRVEIEQMLPDVLMSVCRVKPEHRAALMQWLDAHIEELGGDVKRQYSERGKDLDEVKPLLEATRIRMALSAALASADDDCPFWVEYEEPFRGRQISDDRWQLSFGGGGKGIITHQDGDLDIHFGGAGRFMVGRTWGDRWSTLIGVEGGASASFPKDDEDPTDERSSLVLGLDIVVPAAVRYRLVNTYWEVEAGYLRHYNEEERGGIPGLHVGVAFGGRAARRKAFLPGAVFGVSYERTFPDDSQGDPQDLIKLGFRVAIDVDL